jgi:hypothetical protein
LNFKHTDWLYKFTPMILGALASAVGVIYYGILINQTEGWSLIGILIYVVLIPIFYMLDFLVKFTVNSHIRKIWLIESILLILIYIFRDNLFGLF